MVEKKERRRSEAGGLEDDGTLQSTALKSNETMTKSVAPHVDSFNWFLENGCKIYLSQASSTSITKDTFFYLNNLSIGKPLDSSPKADLADKRLLPYQARQLGITYEAKLDAEIVFCKGDEQQTIKQSIGTIPIMVKSKHCHLNGLSPKELIGMREEEHEVGGYFVVNGNEKIIRLLNVPRRNDLIGFLRPSYSRLRTGCTSYAVSIRCVREEEQTSQTNTMHYVSDGSAFLRLVLNKKEFLLPLIDLLRALVETTDREIYERIIEGDEDNRNLLDSAELLLREAKKDNRYSRLECLSFIGKGFRVSMNAEEEELDSDVGQNFIQRYILPHLTSNQDKFHLLILMLRKLYALVHGKIMADNQDSVMNHEVLLPGFLMNLIFQERMHQWTRSVSLFAKKRLSKGATFTLASLASYALSCAESPGKKISNLLSTGNLNSESGLDLMQTSGFTVIADKLNYLRYMSHFQCIHRGAFFAEMKTTLPRKLLPEAWGFVCPVHTPDGGPCGLLNHLSSSCFIPTHPIPLPSNLSPLLVTLGMVEPTLPLLASSQKYLDVVLNGKVMGKIAESLSKSFVDRLRYFKVKGLKGIPSLLEIAHVPLSEGGRFPGIFLFSSAGRFTRPVISLSTGEIEMIGSFEQVYLDVACVEGDKKGHTTHMEIHPTNILSAVALMTPFSDFNQSPRNMYQCQMGKQTMGTPLHSYPFRTDNKLYRIQNPQIPIVRTKAQSKFQVNDYPTGANAVVAVISYTGYDMEDAMIINKSAYERGFGHGSVYKTELYEATEIATAGMKGSRPYFNNNYGHVASEEFNADQKFSPTLDNDGLPYIGMKIDEGDALLCVWDPNEKRHVVKKWKTNESCYVDEVLVLSKSVDPGNDPRNIQQIRLKLRFNRNPVIGDKFSSRHGQKGVLSQLWPQVDMPFSESGMSPDVIINPHAFPSRMTIGMLVESMAGKAGALHAKFHDSTPFKYNENHTAVDYFGKQLTKSGYNYYGNEPFYSGISGQEFHADIYFGVVYYQRLRHMVKDKFQVRGGIGPVNSITQQPIKGRKKGGGVRFGEMERDSLLAHGASFLLNDRLYNCSDKSTAYVCNYCGSIISTLVIAEKGADRQHPGLKQAHKFNFCKSCQTAEGIDLISIPSVFKYLAAELTAMNLKSTVHTK